MHAPPTPAQVIVRREARLTKLGEPPAAKPKTAVARRVKLNDHLENDATLINHVRMSDLKKNRPSTPDITSDAPKYGTNEETNAYPQRQQWGIKMKFVDSRRKDHRGYRLTRSRLTLHVLFSAGHLRARYRLCESFVRINVEAEKQRHTLAAQSR